MKLMRSTKTGSTCAECGKPIAVGDPIAYYGPRSVFGLTCHSNEKTKKNLRILLAEEAVGREEKLQATLVITPGPEQGVRTTVAAQQEWVLRVYVDRLKEDNEYHQMVGQFVKYLVSWRFAGPTGQGFVEVRAPRNVAPLFTKMWAEQMEKQVCAGDSTEPKIAEAAPLWV